MGRVGGARAPRPQKGAGCGRVNKRWFESGRRLGVLMAPVDSVEERVGGRHSPAFCDLGRRDRSRREKGVRAVFVGCSCLFVSAVWCLLRVTTKVKYTCGSSASFVSVCLFWE
ncbi:unnamed protein product [Ectocarpus sp. 12 AP-2014]